MNRRQFLRNTLFTSALLGTGTLNSLASSAAPKSRLKIKKNDIIVFTGDSITDGARDRSRLKYTNNNPSALGCGYVGRVVSELISTYPDYKLRCHNSGINGNKLFHLHERWQSDVLDLKPTILSILIGVNDYSAAVKSGHANGTPERYEKEYRELLDRTLKARPGIQLVIGEPYAIKGCREMVDRWYPGFESYQEIARRLAAEYNAVFIPYQSVYDEARSSKPPRFYSNDGVHPTIVGINLMKDAWLFHAGIRG